MNIALVLWMAASATLALDSDLKFVTIKSDLLVHSENLNTSEWSGDVQIEDGFYVLNADKVNITYDEEGAIVHIVAIGTPVTVDGPLDKDEVHLEGEIVVYDAQSQIVSASKDAELRTKHRELSSTNIIYNLISQELRATGGANNRAKIAISETN